MDVREVLQKTHRNSQPSRIEYPVIGRSGYDPHTNVRTKPKQQIREYGRTVNMNNDDEYQNQKRSNLRNSITPLNYRTRPATGIYAETGAPVTEMAYNSETIDREIATNKRKQSQEPLLAEKAYIATEEIRKYSVLGDDVTNYFQAVLSDNSRIEDDFVTSFKMNLGHLVSKGTYLQATKSIEFGMLSIPQRVIVLSRINPRSIGVRFVGLVKKQENSEHTFTTYPIHGSQLSDQLYYEAPIRNLVLDTICDTTSVDIRMYDSCGLISFVNPCQTGIFSQIVGTDSVLVTTCFDPTTRIEIGDYICLKQLCTRRRRFMVTDVTDADFTIEVDDGGNSLDGETLDFIIEALDWSFEFGVTSIPSRQESGMYKLRS